MAVTAYTGRPGAGKSYAMVAQVILPGVISGRRVLTNIEGIDPDKVRAHCILEGADPDALGELVCFDGEAATQGGFFPTEATGDAQTFVKGGDLIVFDEWRLYFANSGRIVNADLEPFLRWHRHLTNDKGVACDVVIGTQLITDLHRSFRGLCHRSYKFKKLDAVGAPKVFAWHVFEGHLQPKNGHYAVGNDSYRKEIFALYKSYASGAGGVEAKTDKRGLAFGKWHFMGAAATVIMLGIGFWRSLAFFAPDVPPPRSETDPRLMNGPVQSGAPAPAAPPRSPFRIVGSVIGDDGVRVVLMTDAGAIRLLPPSGFQFDPGGRPISGFVDGLKVEAEDRVNVNADKGVFGL